MAFLAPKPSVSDAGPSRQPYDISGPLPVAYGRHRIPCKLIESPWGEDRKNHGSRRPEGYIYSLALAVCHGPVDRLYVVYLNGRPLWDFSAVRTGEAKFADMTFAGSHNHRGVSAARIYWGRDDQAADPFLNGTPYTVGAYRRNSPRPAGAHPPYRGVCYIIFYDLHLDEGNPEIQGQSSIPAIEAEVFIRPPGQSPVEHDEGYGVNPIRAVRDVLKNPIHGANLPDSALDLPAWDAAATRMETVGWGPSATGVQSYLSPAILSNRKLDDVIAGMMSTFGGFLSTRGGKLAPDWFPARPDQFPDPETLPVISRADMTEEARIEPGGWEGTVSAVSVTTRVFWQRLEEETVMERSIHNRTITGRDAIHNIEAPEIINPNQGKWLATRDLHHMSVPGFRAEIKALRSKARNGDGDPIQPGDIIRLNYEPHALNLLCRVIERDDRPGSPVRLVLENERGRFPEDFIALQDEREIPELAAPAALPLWTLFELPFRPANVGNSDALLSFIGARPHTDTLAADIDIAIDGTAMEEGLPFGTFSAWAQRAKLIELIPDSVDEGRAIHFECLPPFDQPLFRSFTQAETRVGEMLCLHRLKNGSNQLIPSGILSLGRLQGRLVDVSGFPEEVDVSEINGIFEDYGDQWRGIGEINQLYHFEWRPTGPPVNDIWVAIANTFIFFGTGGNAEGPHTATAWFDATLDDADPDPIPGASVIARAEITAPAFRFRFMPYRAATAGSFEDLDPDDEFLIVSRDNLIANTANSDLVNWLRSLAPSDPEYQEELFVSLRTRTALATSDPTTPDAVFLPNP